MDPDLAARASNLERIRRTTAVDPRAEARRLIAAHESVLAELTKGAIDDPSYREWWLIQAQGTLRRLREEIDRL